MCPLRVNLSQKYRVEMSRARLFKDRIFYGVLIVKGPIVKVPIVYRSNCAGTDCAGSDSVNWIVQGWIVSVPVNGYCLNRRKNKKGESMSKILNWSRGSWMRDRWRGK